ncbi:anthrone oxygenase family protein [Nocardia sp. NPDC056100]|uniref:anthrone oxygenase family protein n=1 Tax=Nocardia sp. NPDC056100 TaxID=3345712 RepID=UPI0035DB0DBB
MGIALLSTISLVATGLVAGILLGVAMANVPGFLAMPAEQYVATHQLFDRHYEPTMPALVAIGGIADIGLALMSETGSATTLFILAMLLLVGTAMVSQFANVPLLSSVRDVDPAALSQDWADPRLPWRRWHQIRTVLSTLALAATALAVAI